MSSPGFHGWLPVGEDFREILQEKDMNLAPIVESAPQIALNPVNQKNLADQISSAHQDQENPQLLSSANPSKFLFLRRYIRNNIYVYLIF